jgi:hypothetical protein
MQLVLPKYTSNICANYYKTIRKKYKIASKGGFIGFVNMVYKLIVGQFVRHKVVA